MIKQGMTIEEAAHEWVGGFSRYPYDMIKTLMYDHPDDWREVTEPSIGGRVYVYGPQQSGEIAECYGNGKFRVDLEGGSNAFVTKDDMEIEHDTLLPMWGTMWAFGNALDDYWLEDEDGVRKMSGCGFRVYEHDEWGYFFGIDGAGYDFYEQHWIPLYKARELKWHDQKMERAEG